MTQRIIYKYIPAGVVHVTGDDAYSYLQSQFSNDLSQLEPHTGAIWGFFLNHKGSAMVDGFIVKNTENDFRVISYLSPGHKIKTKIDSNIVADDLQSQEESGWYAASLLGFSANELQADYVFKGRRFPGNSLDIISKQPITLQGQGIQHSQAEDIRIAAGIGLFGLDLLEGELPQECNMSDGISLSKGCYLGQEIMSRLENIGGVRRHLYQVKGQNLNAHNLRSINSQRNLALAVLKDREVDHNSCTRICD